MQQAKTENTRLVDLGDFRADRPGTSTPPPCVRPRRKGSPAGLFFTEGGGVEAEESMKEEHNGHLIAPSCTACPATTRSFTQDQNVDGERAPVKAPGKDGTASPEAEGHWSGKRRQTIIAI